MIPLIWNIQNTQIHWEKEQIIGARGLERKEIGRNYFIGISFWDEEKVLKSDSVMVA